MEPMLKLGAFEFTVIGIFLTVVSWAVFFYLFSLVVKALKKYISSKDGREDSAAVRQSLGEAIKAHRTRLGMTQELVAQGLNVSRQAVSKWESGASEPSTSNLLALCKLFDVSPEEFLRGIE